MPRETPTRVCEFCAQPLPFPYPSGRPRRFCGYSCSAKSRAHRPGPANPNWRGGKTQHPLYERYVDMIGRCYRPTHARFVDYGGRGITVCDTWRSDFWAYATDLGDPPDDTVRWTVDRVDNDGPYSPDNIRWATYSQQQRNRRANKRPRQTDPVTGRFLPQPSMKGSASDE